MSAGRAGTRERARGSRVSRLIVVLDPTTVGDPCSIASWLTPTPPLGRLVRTGALTGGGAAAALGRASAFTTK